MKKTAVFMLKLCICSIGFLVIRYLFLSSFSETPVCFWCWRGHVIHDYYRATGISKNANSPELVIEKYGTPISVDKQHITGTNWDIVHYCYNDFSVDFLTEDYNEYIHNGFTIYGSKAKISRNICIGATRDQIFRAYKKCIKASDDAFYDTGQKNVIADCIQFQFDENNKVTKITYIDNS